MAENEKATRFQQLASQRQIARSSKPITIKDNIALKDTDLSDSRPSSDVSVGESMKDDTEVTNNSIIEPNSEPEEIGNQHSQPKQDNVMQDLLDQSNSSHCEEKTVDSQSDSQGATLSSAVKSPNETKEPDSSNQPTNTSPIVQNANPEFTPASIPSEPTEPSQPSQSGVMPQGGHSKKVEEALKSQWNESWIFEQERRGDFERKLQSNEAWWPAAMSVMRDASFQNTLLHSIIDQQLKLEHDSANSQGDIAVAAAGIDIPTDTNNSKDQDLARIAAAAASASTADLAPGRIISQLGAEMGAEALRRLRTATQCRKVVIEERVDPMMADFAKAIESDAAKGTTLLQRGREIDTFVREVFDAYDQAARGAQHSFGSVQIENDIWLCNLRWRVACVWQGSFWKEITRRFRNLFESLHGLEHGRRITWAAAFEVWQQTVLKSFSANVGAPPFSDTLHRTLKGCASNSSVTHAEMMSSIKRRVPANLADMAPQHASHDEHHHMHYSPIVGNPLVSCCEFIEHRYTYGAGLITSWEAVVAVVTTHGNLLLFQISKEVVLRAAKRSSIKAHTHIANPSAHSILAEWLAGLDPVGPPLPAGHTKAAQVAANARAEAARTGPMPRMPDKISPDLGVVLGKCALSVLPRGENIVELSEDQASSSWLGLFPATTTRITALRAKDENSHNRLVAVLKKHSKP